MVTGSTTLNAAINGSAPVTTKKKRYVTKAVRQSQQYQQQYQRQQLLARQAFLQNRLKSDPINSIIHDESDTISFRANLLKNFINTNDYLGVLLTQNLPINLIKPPAIHENPATELSQLQKKLENNSLEVNALKEKLNTITTTSITLDDLDFPLESFDTVLKEYIDNHGLRVQDNRVVKHKDKFNHLVAQVNEAPSDYWEKQYHKIIENQKTKKRELELQKLREQEESKKKEEERRRKEQEELELKRRREEADALRRQQEQQEQIRQQQQLQQEQQQRQQQPDFTNIALPIVPDELVPNDITSVQVPIAEQVLGTNEKDIQENNENDADKNKNQQDLLDEMFGDYNNEPFNSGFDDGFEDLDNVFF
ncbi:hypothetical protein KAFR_0I01420 [Kazachstania africana CBS 2517]|uniref:Uncharacterized protein n=1 Tax=Kazachstania africana (strain ATCC 22294 / BCRC 22015 / CBS 2517 / CECT 1963 / NBRC 1671 / NRRL Y-8276) TaxID=1071382 RepID=H2AZX3_KAZAF|nr:hypothetical protein KAFR_0I01420 [Kazachstania africana CBS 2517]CCF59923.1 hypothetical protein KAFR_0I01420 [Kazachstania africana CBS 2517]